MTTDEDKISNIYQQGKDQEPSAHLDKSILKAAHEAVEKIPVEDDLSVAKSPFSGGWRATVSIAAVLIIAVILVPMVEQKESVPAMQNTTMETSMSEMSLLKNQSFQQGKATTKSKQLKKEKLKKHMALSQGLSVSEKDFTSEELSAEETPVMAVSSKSQYSGINSVVARQKPAMKNLDYSGVESEFNHLTPQQWLKKIRQLLDKGELKAAKKELNFFKMLYPDNKIDESIIRQIK